MQGRLSCSGQKPGEGAEELGAVVSGSGPGGSDLKVSRTFYTSVNQVDLIFGTETWVLTPRTEKALASFQSRVTRKITGRQPRIKKDGIWDYPPLAGALRKTGMVGIWTSITRRQNTVAQYIATRPILDLCERDTRRPGAWVYQSWWEKAWIDLEGARKQAAESTTRLETESEEESDGEPNEVAGGGEEESQRASGSSVAGQRTDEHSPRPSTGREHGRNKVANLNIRGTESSSLIATVLGSNSTTHY